MSKDQPREAHIANIIQAGTAGWLQACPAEGYLVQCPHGCNLGDSASAPDRAAAERRVTLHRLATAPFGRTSCWADPLSRAERRILREKLARACKRFYNTPAGTPAAVHSQIVASAEMSDLHLDVTERAAVATS